MPRDFAMPRWATFALSIQILLVFFFPPLQWGARKIFLSDIWCGAIVLFGLLPLARSIAFAAFSEKKATNPLSPQVFSFVGTYATISIVLLLVYFHGTARPEIIDNLHRDRYFGLA